MRVRYWIVLFAYQCQSSQSASHHLEACVLFTEWMPLSIRLCRKIELCNRKLDFDYGWPDSLCASSTLWLVLKGVARMSTLHSFAVLCLVMHMWMNTVFSRRTLHNRIRLEWIILYHIAGRYQRCRRFPSLSATRFDWLWPQMSIAYTILHKSDIGSARRRSAKWRSTEGKDARKKKCYFKIQFSGIIII